MEKAFSTAKYLLDLATSEEEPEPLSHLRLQKLLYYVQGWSLALRNKPMFPDRIEAWAHGPVVVSVYPKFAGYGYDAIPHEEFQYRKGLTKSEKRHIEAVWEEYKKYSALSLREMTHKELPWKKARRGLRPADKCSTEITKSSMKRFFEKLIE